MLLDVSHSIRADLTMFVLVPKYLESTGSKQAVAVTRNDLYLLLDESQLLLESLEGEVLVVPLLDHSVYFLPLRRRRLDPIDCAMIHFHLNLTVLLSKPSSLLSPNLGYSLCRHLLLNLFCFKRSYRALGSIAAAWTLR